MLRTVGDVPRAALQNKEEEEVVERKKG